MSKASKQATCHPERKHLAKGLCKACYDREYHGQNKKAVNARKRNWARENPDRVRAARLKYRYGVDEARFVAMQAAQDGICKICATNSATDVDHDHQTNEVRGLLCGDCNRALGLFRDNPIALERAAAYLRLFSPRAEEVKEAA